jgi:hypothetical protein
VNIPTMQVIQKANGLPALINASDYNEDLHATPEDAAKAAKVAAKEAEAAEKKAAAEAVIADKAAKKAVADAAKKAEK